MIEQKNEIVEKTGKLLPIIGMVLTAIGGFIKHIADKKALEQTVEKVVNEKLADK